MLLEDLKQSISQKTVILELVELYGKSGNNIPEKRRTPQKVIRITKSHFLVLSDSHHTSRIYIGNTALIDYDGSTLTFYDIGSRKPSAQERQLLREWDNLAKKSYKTRPTDLYEEKKKFFINSDYPYMSGIDSLSQNGTIYRECYDLVLDNQIRGAVTMKFNVSFEETS